MGLWSKLLRWGRAGEVVPPKPTEEAPAPFVFECQSCGKVFEARRLRPLCPECDSRDVSLLSE
jgi:hypothetical protein